MELELMDSDSVEIGQAETIMEIMVVVSIMVKELIHSNHPEIVKLTSMEMLSIQTV